MPDEVVQTPPPETPPTTPSPAAPDPVDVDENERAAAVEAARMMTAIHFQGEITSLQQQYQSASEEEKPKIAAQIQQRAQVGQRAVQDIPAQVRAWQDSLVAKARETGVPVSVLASASTEQDLALKVIEYKLSHPAPVAPPAATGPATTPAPAASAPRQVDSGITSGVGAEDWRNLPPWEKIRIGLANT